MAKNFKCSFCNAIVHQNSSTYAYQSLNSKLAIIHKSYGPDYTDSIGVSFYFCPNCDNSTIDIIGLGAQFSDKRVLFNPDSLSKIFPNYIPLSIKQDYEEACKIVHLSPKASATLSRRCLQGMIRDYWSISGKKNLAQEIDAIADEVTPQVKKVLDSVRQIGNIGAHMEKDINLIVDIEPNEAQQLINLIEYLMEQWYIQRHEADLMLASIIDINESKQEVRKG